jgi:anti-sigma factor RsiW
MDCRKWEEFGLLYSSGELDGKEARDYEEHLKECEECGKELYLYRREHERFYAAGVLGEAPSPAVDAEILRVCSDPRKQAAAFGFMPAFIRKAVVPALLLVVGFISAGYIMMNMENAGQLKAAAEKEKAAVAAQQQQPVPAVAAADSAGDSAKAAAVNFAKTRGNLSGQGVVPVVESKDK